MLQQVLEITLLVITVISALGSLAYTLIRLVPVIKRLIKEGDLVKLKGFIEYAITQAEKLDAKGEDKLEYALSIVKEQCLKAGVHFDEELIKEGIEAAVALINNFIKK